jgi:cell wall-associated NlpC family hydrolase
MGLPAASATPLGDALPDLADVAAGAATDAPGKKKKKPAAAPVTAPADAPVSFAVTTVDGVTPPPPPPAPRVAQPVSDTAARATATQPVSRTVERAAVVEAAPAAQGGSIIEIARRYIGTPYVYGGTTPSGFDCSGLTQYVYKQVGIALPRTSGSQARAGRQISAAEARPGDLVYPRSGGHIGIYVGNGIMIDAPRSGKPVQERKIWFSDAAFVTFR